KIKKASIKNLPVSVHFKKSGMEIYDPINKRMINEAAKIQMETKIGLETRIKFVSKVALAAGYFAYGDLFIKHADHNSLRRFVYSKDTHEEVSNLKFYDTFSNVKEEDNEMHTMFKNLLKALNGSAVIITFSPSSMIVYVGIGGEYVGTVNFEAD